MIHVMTMAASGWEAVTQSEYLEGILNEPEQLVLRRLTALAQHLFHVPIAYMALVDASGAVTSRIGTGEEYAPQIRKLLTDAPLERLAVAGASPPALGPQTVPCFVASAPLRTRDGISLGVLVIADLAPRPGFSAAERETLIEFAGVLAGKMELRRIASQALDSGFALRDAERRFRDIADAAAVLIIYTGADGQALFVNRAWQEFTGRTLQQSQGEAWVECIHLDDRDLILEAYWKAFQERVPFSAEARMRRRDGIYRWMLGQGTPRFRHNGAFAGFMGCLTDITNCHEALTELEKQTHCCQAIAAACGVEYLLIHPAGHIQRHSRGCLYNSAEQLPETVREGIRRASERRAAIQIETPRTVWTITPMLSPDGDLTALTAVLAETVPPV